MTTVSKDDPTFIRERGNPSTATAEHARQISPPHNRHWQGGGCDSRLGSQLESTSILHKPPGSQQGWQIGLSEILSTCVISLHMGDQWPPRLHSLAVNQVAGARLCLPCKYTCVCFCPFITKLVLGSVLQESLTTISPCSLCPLYYLSLI